MFLTFPRTPAETPSGRRCSSALRSVGARRVPVGSIRERSFPALKVTLSLWSHLEAGLRCR